jgi:hypothetical protein
MISGSYIISGVLLAVTAYLFNQGTLTSTTQTLAWCLIFFFASAGASAAYLTVSEIFPMETRAMSIALFYAIGTGLGGIIGPLLYGKLVAGKDPTDLAYGYGVAAALMIGAGVVQAVLGVEAAKRSLEDVATPLSTEAAEGAEPEREPERERERVGAGAGRPATVLAASGRRLQFGPSRSGGGYSPPGAWGLPSDDDSDTREQADVLVNAVRGRGEASRAQLSRLSRYWGPGCFRAALRTALDEGRLVRVGRDHYAVAEDAGAQRDRVGGGRFTPGTTA